MKSVRSRLTVTFIGLIAVILAVIWGVNKWYLEDFYVTKKVQALNAMYTAIDAQIAENKDNGITIEEAMERDRDANGNITEGNLQRLIRNFSDSANVSVLIIDNSTEDATVYSTSRDTKFLKDRVDRYIFGWAKAKYTIEEAMERDRDANGNITEGNLQRLIRNFSDSANVSVLIIDNSTEDATVYSTSRDTKFLKDRVDRYIFGWAKAKYTILEENEQYKIQKTYDPQRESMYLESWGFFTDNSTAFIMSAPLSSVGESVRLANQFLLYVGIIAAAIGGLVIYLTARQISKPIYRLSNLSERMSNLDFEAKYEPEKHEMEEIQVLGNSMNTLSERLEETISELKSANNQLTKDIEEKTKIDEMRKEFIANVSHELKTPIALIQGYAEGLQEGMGEEKESRDYYCDVIVDEANKMNQMVKQLLTLSSLESGNDKPVMDRFNLTELIKGVVNASKILIEQNQIRVEFDDQTPVYVWADEFKIEQVVTNYLSNAIHHIDGEKKIIIRMIPENGLVRVSVFNTGTPIPEEAIPNLWTKFYKVDKARTRAYGGTGIGLSIVKAIMDAHNQQYGVKNWENGVEFWFTLDGRNS